MIQYNWPGNVRELENEVERVVALSVDDTVTIEDLSRDILNGCQCIEPHEIFSHSLDKSDKIDDMEKKHILRILDECNGNKSEAAKRLGISREGLRKKFKRMSIADLEN